MVNRLRLKIARDQLEQAICDVEYFRARVAESTNNGELGYLWRAQDRLWFWNLGAGLLTKLR